MVIQYIPLQLRVSSLCPLSRQFQICTVQRKAELLSRNLFPVRLWRFSKLSGETKGDTFQYFSIMPRLRKYLYMVDEEAIHLSPLLICHLLIQYTEMAEHLLNLICGSKVFCSHPHLVIYSGNPSLRLFNPVIV